METWAKNPWRSEALSPMKAWLTNTYAYTLYGVFIKSLQKIVNEFNDTMSKNENYDKNVQKKQLR